MNGRQKINHDIIQVAYKYITDGRVLDAEAKRVLNKDGTIDFTLKVKMVE